MTSPENSTALVPVTQQERLPYATHSGTIRIANFRLPCNVLNDSRRLLSDSRLARMFNARTGAMRRGQSKDKQKGGALPLLILTYKNLKPFIPEELFDGPSLVVSYIKGLSKRTGYEAKILPKICEVWLKARNAGVLDSHQLAKAYTAELIMRGLAEVGIIALIDEATGYQEIRDRLALEAILNKYFSNELAAWAMRFPPGFYKELFRLYGLEWRENSTKRPKFIGQLTNDLIYSRMAPHVVEELKSRNPKNGSGNRAYRHHQFFSDTGHTDLNQVVHTVWSFARIAQTKEELKRYVELALPKKDIKDV